MEAIPGLWVHTTWLQLEPTAEPGRGMPRRLPPDRAPPLSPLPSNRRNAHSQSVSALNPPLLFSIIIFVPLSKSPQRGPSQHGVWEGLCAAPPAGSSPSYPGAAGWKVVALRGSLLTPQTCQGLRHRGASSGVQASVSHGLMSTIPVAAGSGEESCFPPSVPPSWKPLLHCPGTDPAG